MTDTLSLFNPAPPAQWHSPTSVAAAEAIRPDVPALERRVLAAIEERGGLTDEEGQDVTGLGGSTYRPRRIRLMELGLVRDSGRTRPTRSGRAATVWTAAAAEGTAGR